MSLYLCVFDGDEEIAGWVVGSYKDFACFRKTVRKRLSGPNFPTLLEHSDSDGEWALKDLPALKREIELISLEFKKLPADEPVDGFRHTAHFRMNARTLYDCFHNVDGENLLEAMRQLCDEAISRRQPILFQ